MGATEAPLTKEASTASTAATSAVDPEATITEVADLEAGSSGNGSGGGSEEDPESEGGERSVVHVLAFLDREMPGALPLLLLLLMLLLMN